MQRSRTYEGSAAQVAFWLGQLCAQGKTPTRAEIESRWHCSHATACRYYNFALDLGQVPMSARGSRRKEGAGP